MRRLTNILCLAMSLFFTFSCGLMELEEDIPQVEVNMFFERDTIYVMQGESFAINPVFEPDTIPLGDVYWTSADEDVARFSFTDGSFTAVGEGWTTVSGTSVLYQKVDTCHVCVMKSWDYQLPVYPYETIFYADVTVHGKPFDAETMKLYAYIDDELCGIGVQRESHGIRYMELRVGSEMAEEGEKDSEEDPLWQLIKFKIYDKSRLIEEEVPGLVIFDGLAHGTLGKLYRIEIK